MRTDLELRSGKLSPSLRVVLLILITISGCGGTGSQVLTTSRQRTIAMPTRRVTGGSPAAVDMLVAMVDDDRIDNLKINNVKEASVASQRAQRTLLAITSLNRQIRGSGLGDGERGEKESAVERLREQYRRELLPLDAFYNKLERKGKELERILAFKDPEIERIDKELKRVYESSDKNKDGEIVRIRGEFERRSKELLAKDTG
jgi:hypothetical protein